MTMHHDIDKLFKNGLSDYSENPPGFIWDNIHRKLNNKRLKKRRNIYYSIAASVALLLSFGAGYLFTGFKSNNYVSVNTNSEPPKSEATVGTKVDSQPAEVQYQNSEQPKEAAPIEDAGIDKNNTVKNIDTEQKNNNSEINPKVEPKVRVKKAASEGTLLPPMFGNSEVYNSNESMVENNESTRNNNLKNIELKRLDASKLNKSKKLNYDERQLIAATDYAVVSPSEKKNSIWSVGVSAAPLLSYRDVASVSDESLKTADVYTSYEQNYANEKPLMSYSAGMNVNFNVAKRWRIQSGLYFSEMGQVSENISLEGQPIYSAATNNSYSINTSTGNVEIAGSQNDLINKFSDASRNQIDNSNDLPMVEGVYGSSGAELETNIVQTYDYYEIPIVVNYTVIDNKLSMNVNGGLSANVLYSNSTYIENNGDRYELNAQTDDLRNMNYSGVVGLGFEYPIVEKLKVNLNPTFRYALSSINTSGTVYPYSFGIYTGLRYNF